MAQEANGLPYNSSNPSGIGAVYLSNPVDLLALQKEQDATTAAGFKDREEQHAKKKAVAAGLVGDMKLDAKGIMDTDAPYFKERANEISKLYQDALRSGQDPDNPAFIAANTKYQNAKQQLMFDIEESKTQKELFGNAAKGYDPTKHDDKSLENMGMFRAAPFDKRTGYDASKLLLPKKSTLLELTKGKLLKGVGQSTTSQTVKDPVSGAYQVQKTTTYTPNQINGLANLGYSGDADIHEQVNNAYEKLDANRKASFEEASQELEKQQGQSVSPMELYYREVVGNLNSSKDEAGGLQYSPQQRAYWDNYYKKKDDEAAVKYDVEAITKALSKDPTFWGQADGGMSLVDKSDPSKVDMKIAPTLYSSALNGHPLGKATVKVMEVNNGKTHIVYKSIDNRVLNMKLVDGKVYMQTDESLAKKDVGDGDGWEEMNERTADKLAFGYKDPIKAQAALRKTLVDKNAYPNQNVNLGTDKPKQNTDPLGLFK